MEQEFHSIRRLPPYVFAEVNAMKARARAAGEDIIDFGMGNPDCPTPPHIVEKLIETSRDPRTHRYSNSRGIPGLRKAIAGGAGARLHGVDLGRGGQPPGRDLLRALSGPAVQNRGRLPASPFGV